MLPRLLSLEWGSLVFHLNGYGFAIFCGTLAALAISLRRAKETSLPLRPLLRVFMVAVAGLFAGAKLAYLLQYGWSSFPGGWVFYGGLIGGTAAAAAACRRWGLPTLAVADLGVPCALLAAAFGRVGCFFAGCCFGTVWDGGVCYPPRSQAWKHQLEAGLIGPNAPRSLPTAPAQLLESLALLAIFVAGSLVWSRRARAGRTLATCGLLYSIWRFAAESWRGDHDPYWGSALTFSQGISLALFAGSLVLFRIRPKAEAALLTPEPGWSVAGQVSTILLAVAVLTGGIGCSSAQRYGVRNDFWDGCFRGCTEACVSACAEACEESCKQDCEKSGNGPRTAAPSREEVSGLRLPSIEPTKPYIGKLSVVATLNETEAQLLLSGSFTLSTKDNAGAQVVNIQVSSVVLKLGNLSLSAAPGDAVILIDSKGRSVFRVTTLSPEVASVLKAFEPFSRGFLEVDSPDPAARQWSDRLLSELNTPNARGECRGELTLNDENHSFSASALITQTANGDRRVQWMFRR